MSTPMWLRGNVSLIGGERATGRQAAPVGQFDGLVRSML